MSAIGPETMDGARYSRLHRHSRLLVVRLSAGHPLFPPRRSLRLSCLFVADIRNSFTMDFTRLDEHIERLRAGDTLTENEIKALCDKVGSLT